MLDHAQAESLEVLIDDRLEPIRHTLPAETVATLGDSPPDRARELLAPWRAGRRIEWAAQTVTQGELIAAFADHCEAELEDVEVLERDDDLLVARWRRETSRLELRAGFVGVELLASSTPTVLLGDIEPDEERLLQAFLDDADLRSRLAICDLGRLERIGAVRSSVFVYLEWFLRDAHGVKLQPSPKFTQGLIDRGVISLGMG